MTESTPTPRRKRALIGLAVGAILVVGAPLVGVLATVVQLRRAFAVTATADPSEKAKLLAEGISESMNCTAAGLVVALVALAPTILFAVRLAPPSKKQPTEHDPPK